MLPEIKGLGRGRGMEINFLFPVKTGPQPHWCGPSGMEGASTKSLFNGCQLNDLF